MAAISHEDHIGTRLTAVEKGVNALLTAMNLVIDTVQQQTNLLAELVDAAKQEPGDSPVVESIDALTGAVVKMGAGIEMLRANMDKLPDLIIGVLDHNQAPTPGDAEGASE